MLSIGTGLVKCAAPVTAAGYYEKERKAALKDFNLSPEERERLMKSYLKHRGQDTNRVTRRGLIGAIPGAAMGAVVLGGHGFRQGGLIRAIGQGLGGAAVGGALSGIPVAGWSELQRRAALRAAQDPESVKALLSRTRGRGHLKKQYDLVRRLRAAQQGKKRSESLISVEKRSYPVIMNAGPEKKASEQSREIQLLRELIRGA